MAEDLDPQPIVEGTTRRDALKLGGAAALGGVAAMLATGAVVAEPAGAVTTPAHIPTSLRLAVDGAAITGIQSMELNESELATAPSQDPATGEWTLVPTGLLTQRVSLTRRWSSTKNSMVDMYTATKGKTGATSKRTVNIQVRGRKGSLMATFVLQDCFPVRWEGPTYDAKLMQKGGTADQPTETIHFSYQKIEWT